MHWQIKLFQYVFGIIAANVEESVHV